MSRKIQARIQYLEHRLAIGIEPHHPFHHTPKAPTAPKPPTHHTPPATHHEAPRPVGQTSSGKKIEFHHDSPSHKNFSEMDHLEAHGKHKAHAHKHMMDARRWSAGGHAEKAKKHLGLSEHHTEQSRHHYNSAVKLHPPHAKALPKTQF